MRFRAALVLLLALSGAARAQATHDTLTIGMAQFPSSLHPDIDPEVVKSYVMGFVVRPITAFDKDWHNSCLLCTELPTLDNGLAKVEDRPDGSKGMAVTIKLKPGLQWGDGQPVTARDIAFTWTLGRDPASGFANNNPWGRATSVDVVDDHTAVLHLDRVRADYAQWDQILPEHVEAAVVTKAASPGAYINATGYNREPLNPGLYDGPYMITAYDSGNQIVLEPNPHWAGTRPGFKRIVLRHIESTAALQANLLSGDVDMVVGEGVGLTIDQALALQKAHPDQFRYEFKPSLTYEHIDLKKENPLLADVRVRRALLMAMDRRTMVDRLFQGKQPVAATWVNPLSPNFDAAVPVVPYDLAGARALLKEAGWTPGADGVCRNAAGDRLAFELGHHRRQPAARVAGAGAAIRLEERLHRGDDQERTRPHPVRRHAEASQLHGHGDVRLEQRRHRIAAAHARDVADPDRGEQLRRRQLPRVQRPQDGRRYPRRRRRAGPGQAEGDLGRHAAHLRRGGAGAAAVLPRRTAYHADLAAWLPAHWAGRHELRLVRELAPRLIRFACALLALVFAAAAGEPDHRTLVIGVSSFPSTLQPAIDPDAIKFYVLGFADRPVTGFDGDRRPSLPALHPGPQPRQWRRGHGGRGDGGHLAFPAGAELGRRRPARRPRPCLHRAGRARPE